MSKTLISLIPKQQPPQCMSHFRPISLCNMVIKIITKVLANHLKSLMPKLMSSCLSSFVEGRQDVNNIVIVQVVIYTLQKRKGRRGAMVAKIDLEKLYDLIKWSFLLVVLSVGFSLHTTELIMYCITSAKLAVLWNGNILLVFSPTMIEIGRSSISLFICVVQGNLSNWNTTGEGY